MKTAKKKIKSLNSETKKTFPFKKNKYNAKPTTIDGIRFPSIGESELYLFNKARPEVVHIDVHVPCTMIIGEGDKREVIRYSVDQIVYINDHESIKPRAEAHEFKGIETADFKLKMQIFNAVHPLAPLKVFKKSGKNIIQVY